MEERNRIILETVKDMLEAGDQAQAIVTVEGLHSADAAEVLAGIDMAEEVKILTGMEPRSAARSLLEMEEGHQVEVAAKLRTGELRDLLQRMPVDEAVDLLGDIPEEQRLTLLRLFEREEAGEFAELLSYSYDSAGGLMTTDYVSVSPGATAEEVIEQLRAVDPEVETIYYVYVVDDDGRLEGVLSLRELITSPPERKVGEMVSSDTIKVQPDDDQENVAEVIAKYDLLAVPVTNDQGSMLGIVTVDDVLEVIGDEAQEDIMRFAGATSREEELRVGLWANIGRRLPWFALTALIEILIAAGILKLYSPVLEKYVVLIFFIPLLVTMGGNISIQSSTIMGRWLTSGAPFSKGTLKTFTGEVAWGVLFGAFAGAAVAGLCMALKLGASIGLVVGLSLALTVLAAALVGCGLPFVLKALKRDPSAVSGPLIGTTMDVVSLAIYLAIGSLLI
ncbi:MAG: magnesium transporter [Actinobacteria bacterium]|nr:magnesium transporter [Actinomycetota bacterium]